MNARHARLAVWFTVLTLAGCRDSSDPNRIGAPSFAAEDAAQIVTIDHQVPHISTVPANVDLSNHGDDWALWLAQSGGFDVFMLDFQGSGLSPLGQIAQTTRGKGSITIAGSFTITAESATDPSVGERVNKVGRTTGWTRGRVSNTCVTVNVFGSDITQLCQAIVKAGVGAGDSGSPVFSGSTNVTLYGILWGGNLFGSSFVYSPLKNIERTDELGPLATF